MVFQNLAPLEKLVFKGIRIMRLNVVLMTITLLEINKDGEISSLTGLFHNLLHAHIIVTTLRQ